MKKNAHSLQLFIRYVVKDPKGRIISDSGERISHSFVIQFLEWVYGLSGGGPNFLDATTIINTEENIYAYDYETDDNFRADAGINDDTHGIVVGTGNTGETNADYALDVQLTEGAGAGDITHNVMNFETALEVGANIDFVMHRSFTNNTGALITVREAGIYIKSLRVFSHCIARDVLPSPVSVPDMCSITVFYLMRTTV